MRLRVSACVLVAILAAPAAAHAQRAEISQQLFDGHGDPLLAANSVPYGRKGTTHWYACPAQATCTPVAPREAYELVPGPTAAGTRFELTLDSRGHRTEAFSHPWLGRVTAVSPPVLSGTAAVGATVSASAATWTGGWGGEFEELRGFAAG
jgi:hypothetical protein